MYDNKNFQDEFNLNLNLDGIKNWFKKTFRNIKISILLFLAIITILNSVYIMDTGKIGVIFRFGEFVREDNISGVRFKVPFIEKVTKVDVEKSYKLEYGYRTIREGTEISAPQYRTMPNESKVIVGAKENNSSIVLIELMVRYKIDDPYKYLIKVDDVRGTMEIALEDVLRNTIQALTLSEALTDKAKIDEEILPELQKKMEKYGAGIRITEVKTQNTDLLAQVNKAYQEVEKATQYKNSKIEEAQKYRNQKIPKAEAEAIKLIEEAKAYRADVVATAKSETAQYEAVYKEYIQNRTVTKEKYYVDAMRTFLSNNNVVIDGTKNGNVYKFLNLEKNPVTQQVTGN